MKKSKSVNKGLARVANKDEKPKHKKRKLPRMLGPRWSKLELEQFYQAYRKYGKDWKKVASAVRSRSIEMVEALHRMNKAYLSLPDGSASVHGLIAMMTDHYNVNDESASDRENDEHTVISRKIPKHSNAKVQVGPVKVNNVELQSVGPSYRVGFDAFPQKVPVKKRTARVPVSCLGLHPKKKSRGSSSMNISSDKVSCGAFSFREAHQTPSPRYEPSHNLALTKGHLGFLGNKPTNSCVSMKEESAADGSLGSNEIRNGDWVRDCGNSVISASSEFERGGKMGKKEEIALSEAKIFRSGKEPYDFAERRHPGKSYFEGARTHKSTSEAQRKRSRNLRFEDERDAFDALQTLAEMSEMMPFLSDNPVEDGGNPISKTVRDEDIRVYKKKRVTGASKAEVHGDHYVKPAENKTSVDKEVKPSTSNGQISTISRSNESSMKSPDVSLTIDRPSEQVDAVVSSSQVHPVTQIVNVTRRKTSRKKDRTSLHIDRNSAPNACRDECMSSAQYSVQYLKEKVSRCLTWHDVRKWCIYEWFYSAIDYPWFAKREFVEYLEHVGLGHVPRLTRVEWGVIRSSLGKPRRFSQRFLQEEREKLNQYRESVRAHYGKLRAGHGEGLPTDLARPLSVGQRVVAIHPKTRDVHNGSILTVDHQSCLIQFDSPELGVELVMDIDCMPLHPVENMPKVLRRAKMSFDSHISQGRDINNGSSTLASQEHVKISSPSDLNISSFNPSITSEAKPVSTSRAAVTGNGSLGTSSLTQSYNNTGHKNDLRLIPGLKQTLHGKGPEQQNGYLGNQVCLPQPGGLNGTTHPLNSSSTFNCCQDTESNVAEVVKGSRDAAKRMVDIAIEAITSIKEGDDAFGRIGEALEAPNKTAEECGVNYKPSVLDTDASRTTSANACAENDTEVPSKLISSCVATLLMIQACTERQFPPGEVAQIIDNAVSSLQPCCSQNLSIYREIQMCMGRIKTQILALVPT